MLGARLHEYGGPMGSVRGVSFAVWAPRAKAVRVIGDFNDWDGRIHPMRLIGASGVWELFVPDVGVGHVYKYEIRGADDVVRTKADPMARRTETPAEHRLGRRRVGPRVGRHRVDGRAPGRATRTRAR